MSSDKPRGLSFTLVPSLLGPSLVPFFTRLDAGSPWDPALPCLGVHPAESSRGSPAQHSRRGPWCLSR